MTRPKYFLAASLLSIVPFVYSFDDDPYRAWEVVGVGGVAFLLGAFIAARFVFRTEHLLIATFCALLLAQPLFKPDISLWFNFQYAGVLVAAFVPSAVIDGARWRREDFESGMDFGVRIIAVIVVANIVGGRLFGFGETYDAGGVSNDVRAFGFLGDSISPVIIFPLIYFIAQRRLLWAGALIASMALTGGKAAAIMAILAVPVWAVAAAPRLIQIASLLALFVFGFGIYPAINSFLENLTSNDAVAYSLNTRLLSYQVGWQYFVDNPWLGVGINQSMHSVKLDADEMAYFEGVTKYFSVYQIHNAYVRTLAETGIGGFAILMALSIVWLSRSFAVLTRLRSRSANQARRLSALVLASSLWSILFIATYQTTGWFEHGHPQLAWLLIIQAIGLVAARLLELPTSAPRPDRAQASSFSRLRAG